MKKIVVVAVLLIIVSTGSVFAASGWAIGLGYNFDFNNGAGAPSLMLQVPGIPIMWGIGYSFTEYGYLNVSADWWLYRTHLVGILNLYLGPGVWVRFNTGPASDFRIGMEVPVGFQIFVIKPLELFLEPALLLEFYPNITPYFGAKIGFRFWF